MLWYYKTMKKAQIAVLAVITLSVLAIVATNQNMPWMQKQVVAEKPVGKQVVIDKSPHLDLEKIFSLVNEERSKVGLTLLVRDPMLDKSAADKCADMVAKDYWSHKGPDGLEAWYFVKKYNYYNEAGENLAYGFRNEQSIVEGWMKSPGHKENIVKPTFTNVGYAECEYSPGSKQGEGTLIVRHFADNPFE